MSNAQAGRKKAGYTLPRSAADSFAITLRVINEMAASADALPKEFVRQRLADFQSALGIPAIVQASKEDRRRHPSQLEETLGLGGYLTADTIEYWMLRAMTAELLYDFSRRDIAAGHASLTAARRGGSKTGAKTKGRGLNKPIIDAAIAKWRNEHGTRPTYEDLELIMGWKKEYIRKKYKGRT